MLGDLFYRGAAPDTLEAMSYHRLCYWHHWHDVLAKAERKAAEGK